MITPYLIPWMLLIVQPSRSQVCIDSDSLTLCVNETSGSISSISALNTNLKLASNGFSWIGDDTFFNTKNILSLNVSSKANSNSISVVKTISHTTNHSVTLNDSFSVSSNDPSVIEWKLTLSDIVSPNNIPFSTAIATQFNLTNTDDIYYWTMHSGDYNANYTQFTNVLELLNGSEIKDTLYTQLGDKYVDSTIRNNAPNGHPRQVSVFPLSIFLSKSDNNGISFVYDLNSNVTEYTNIILGATMDINSKYQLFKRYYNKLYPNMNKNIQFTTYIVLNKGFTWRDTLNWTVNKFPNIFKPSGSPNTDKITNNVGLGLYSCAAARDMNNINVVNNSGANILWDAQFWYVYQGMSLPPVNNWTSYHGAQEEFNCGEHFHHGEMATREKVASHYKNMSNIGITALSYFNLFEWGANVTWPLKIDVKNISHNAWLNSSIYLSLYMNDSVVFDSNGNTIYEGSYNGLVLDPWVDSYYNQIVNQTYEHIYSFGDQFYGLGIDRQDWTTYFNYRRYDNYSLCPGNIECSSLLLSWKKLARQVGIIVHEKYTKNTAIISTNYKRQRMDLLIISDVIFTEESDMTHLLSNGLSSMAIPCIEWTYNSNEVLTQYGGPHRYFQNRLFLNILSMAPVLGADHSITPNNTVQYYYNEYNLSFRVLRGTSWWLQADTAELICDDSNNNKNECPIMNSFISNENSNEIFIVLVLGFNLTESVNVVNVSVTGVESVEKCDTLYPGQDGWNTAMVEHETKLYSNVVQVPLKYGCGIAHCYT